MNSTIKVVLKEIVRKEKDSVCHFCINDCKFKFLDWDDQSIMSIGVCERMGCISKIPFEKIKLVKLWK